MPDMAAKDAPFGLQPWGNVLSANLYPIVTAYATPVYVGDLVERGAASLATKGLGQVIRVAVEETGAAGSLLGAVLAVFDHNMDPLKYLPASSTGDGVVAGYVLVADSPHQRYIIQEDGDTTSMQAADIGLNADAVSTHTGSNATGRSKMELDVSSKNTTSTLALKVHAAHPEDTISTTGAASNWCRFIVTINSHHNAPNIDGV